MSWRTRRRQASSAGGRRGRRSWSRGPADDSDGSSSIDGGRSTRGRQPRPRVGFFPTRPTLRPSDASSSSVSPAGRPGGRPAIALVVHVSPAPRPRSPARRRPARRGRRRADAPFHETCPDFVNAARVVRFPPARGAPGAFVDAQRRLLRGRRHAALCRGVAGARLGVHTRQVPVVGETARRPFPSKRLAGPAARRAPSGARSTRLVPRGPARAAAAARRARAPAGGKKEDARARARAQEGDHRPLRHGHKPHEFQNRSGSFHHFFRAPRSRPEVHLRNGRDFAADRRGAAASVDRETRRHGACCFFSHAVETGCSDAASPTTGDDAASRPRSPVENAPDADAAAAFAVDGPPRRRRFSRETTRTRASRRNLSRAVSRRPKLAGGVLEATAAATGAAFAPRARPSQRRRRRAMSPEPADRRDAAVRAPPPAQRTGSGCARAALHPDAARAQRRGRVPPRSSAELVAFAAARGVRPGVGPRSGGASRETSNWR